jgi:hypothetical protein
MLRQPPQFLMPWLGSPRARRPQGLPVSSQFNESEGDIWYRRALWQTFFSVTFYAALHCQRITRGLLRLPLPARRIGDIQVQK